MPAEPSAMVVAVVRIARQAAISVAFAVTMVVIVPVVVVLIVPMAVIVTSHGRNRRRAAA